MTTSTMETIYYATPTLQVSLKTIAPGQALSGAPSNQNGLWMPISEGLTDQVNAPVKQGTYLEWKTLPNNHCYQNSSNHAVEVLELAWVTVPASRQKPIEDVTEVRPWGSFTVLADAPHFKLKQIWVNGGNRLSLQRHQKREEHWFVTAGAPTITVGEEILTPPVGDYVHIPLQAWHRLANPSTDGVGAEIIELQLGTYFGEDDIERQSDDYGR